MGINIKEVKCTQPMTPIHSPFGSIWTERKRLSASRRRLEQAKQGAGNKIFMEETKVVSEICHRRGGGRVLSCYRAGRKAVCCAAGIVQKHTSL